MHRQMKQFNKFCVSFPINKDASIALSKMQNVMTISAQKGFVSQTDFFNKSVASSTLDNYYLVLKDEFCYNKSYSNGYPMGAIKRLKEADKAVVTTLYICFSITDKKAVL